MADPTTAHLRSDQPAAFRVPEISDAAAEKTAELLQKNHEANDIIFNDDGFHSELPRMILDLTTTAISPAYHIVHHLLTVFALGGTPEILETHYKNNASYQRPPQALDEQTFEELKDPDRFVANMNDTKNYRAYLKLFEEELRARPYQDVINEYLLKGNERANIMFNRSFSSIYHPQIHLGFGIEFEQPMILAEALVETAFHPAHYDALFIDSDAKAKANARPGRHMVDLIDMAVRDIELKQSPRWTDNNRIRDGVMARARDRMTDLASQWIVRPDELEQRLAEIVNTSAYMAAAAQRPDKEIKFDFFLMHGVNHTIFLAHLMKQDWISVENKIKILEWRGRADLLLYVSRGSPKLRLNQIKNYKRRYHDSSWDALFRRATLLQDDGHASKLVRAFAHGENICRPYEHLDHFKIKGYMWKDIAHMALDSTEKTENRWVRNAGFDEAWESFGPPRNTIRARMYESSIPAGAH